jgi:prepilin-type N-terminal cleavage/methylation domain-containing protein
MKMRRPDRRQLQSGFTLLEMVISLALLLILSGAILGGMATMQKNYRSNEIRTILNGQMRASMELMAQEVGQAGLPPSGMASNSVYTGTGASGAVASVTNASAITANATLPTTVTIATNPPASVQLNQVVIADTGTNAEVITILGPSGSPTNQFSAIFQKNHAANFSLYPHGVYPQGITFQNAPAFPAGTSAYSNTSLIAFGDITGTGNLTIVEYVCPTATTTGTITDSSGVQWGPLTRTEYVYPFTATPTSATLLGLVRVATAPSGTPADGCRFDYNVFYAAGWYMVTSVNVTIVAESQTNDPQTKAPVVITKSFMNIQPRNIVNAYTIYNYSMNLSTPTTPTAEFLSIPTAVVTQIGTFTQ